MISQSEAPEPEEIKVYKHQRDICALSSATGELGSTGGTRASLTPEKRIPRKKKI